MSVRPSACPEGSLELAPNKAHVLALTTAHVLRLNRADVLALNKAHVLRLNNKICPVFRANAKEAAFGRPPLWSLWPSFGVPLAVLGHLWDPFGSPWAALGRLLDFVENWTSFSEKKCNRHYKYKQNQASWNSPPDLPDPADLPEVLSGRAGQALGSPRAGGQDYMSLNKLPQIKT